jgi:hypothetical protein
MLGVQPPSVISGIYDYAIDHNIAKLTSSGVGAIVAATGPSHNQSEGLSSRIEPCPPQLPDMGILDDPTDPHSIENLRRSIVMLNPGQTASIDRDPGQSGSLKNSNGSGPSSGSSQPSSLRSSPGSTRPRFLPKPLRPD